LQVPNSASRKLRLECRCDRAGGRRLSSDSAEFAAACRCIPSADRSEIRRHIPALPFCHVRLKAEKPKSPKYPKYLKSIGDHIRKKRLDLGLLQRDVAAQIGVSQDTIYNWERNANSPQVHELPAVIRFLGYNPLPLARTAPDRLVRARHELGLTQKAMAGRLGIDPTTLARREKGKKRRLVIH
jgi:transcriptional regulator with XRE-family HTH domain